MTMLVCLLLLNTALITPRLLFVSFCTGGWYDISRSISDRNVVFYHYTMIVNIVAMMKIRNSSVQISTRESEVRERIIHSGFSYYDKGTESVYPIFYIDL